MRRLLVAAALTLTSCQSTRMLELAPTAIVTEKSEMEIASAIAGALAYYNWRIDKHENNIIQATRYGGWSVTIEIVYSQTEFQIRYKDSTDFNYNADSKTIDTHYNGWIQELNREIKIRIYNTMVAPGL